MSKVSKSWSTEAKVFKGRVEIVPAVPGGYGWMAEAYDHKPADYRLMQGPWRATKEQAMRDLASWLEDNGFTHPLTHG